MSRLLLVAVLAATAPLGCSGPEKIVKKVKKDPKQNEQKQALAEARDEAASGHNENADKAYSQAYDVNKDWDVFEEWVDFLLHAGRASRAIEVTKGFYDANPMDVKGYALYCDALLAGNKGADALDVANKLLGFNGDDPGAHERKGRALLLLDKNDDALDELRKAVQLDPDTARFHISLGNGLHKNGDINKAQLEFRAALKSAPDDPEANTLLGMALRDQGEYDEAKSYLDKAIQLDPKNGRAYFELGVLYNKQLKQTEAEEAFGKAVKYSPNESLFWYAYGEIYRVQSRNEEAINAYRRAVDLDPPFPKAIGKLGQVLVLAKQYDDAEPVLIQAIRREPKAAINYLNLGAVYQAKKKPRQAIDNYELFLKYAPTNDPDRRKAREAISELKRKSG